MKPDNDFAELRHGVRSVVSQFDSRYWQEVDEARAFPEKFVTALTEAGWLSALIPEEYGGFAAGGESDYLAMCVATEELSWGSLGAGGALAPTHMLKSNKGDGYVLAQLAQPILRIPHIQKTEFDVLNDFTWIIRIVDYT